MKAARVAAKLGAFVAALTLTASARAQDCDNKLVSACINSDTLWPHAGPSRFQSVGGAETTGDGRVSFGLVTTYLSRPIMIHSPSPAPDGSDRAAIDDQVNGTFLFAYGVTRKLELDLAIPMTFGQGGAGVSSIVGSTELRDTATRDMRFGLTYAIVPRPRVDPSAPASKGFGLAGRFEVSAPIGDKDQFAGEKWGVFAPSLAADYRLGRWFFGAEAGVRVRHTAELVGARVGTQGVFGLGGGYDILDHEWLSVMAEARAMPIFVEQATSTQTAQGLISTPNGGYIVPAEWELAARTAPLAGGDLAISLGGGGWLPFSSTAPITTPRWRFTLAVVFAPLAHDTDGDGVTDDVDKCPRVAGPKSSDAGIGCPAPPPKPAEVIDATTPAPAPAPPSPPPQPVPAPVDSSSPPPAPPTPAPSP